MYNPILFSEKTEMEIRKSIRQCKLNYKNEPYESEIINAIKSCRPGTIRTFDYQHHLSDNVSLVSALSEDIADNDACHQISLYATCGSGKTYLMLTSLAEELPGKCFIMASPTAILAEQNSRYHYHVDGAERHPIVITGESNNDVDIVAGRVYSVVYDSIRRFMPFADPGSAESGTKDLSSVVFIIDEAHQVIDAKNYRQTALRNIEYFAAAIQRAGGTVIRLTGTPNKLMGCRSDVQYICRHVKDGAEIPAYTFRSLSVIQKKDKNATFEAFLWAQVQTAVTCGYIPFIMYNDKKTLDKIRQRIQLSGFTVGMLTADDKGYHVETDLLTGQKTRAYDNDYYGGLQGDATLPFADVYLATSVIEVGTSIQHVSDASGKQCQPSRFMPIYACNRADNFDLDSMMQFFSRPRFPVERAIIATNAPTRAKKAGNIKTFGQCIAEEFVAVRSESGAHYTTYLTPAIGNPSHQGDSLIYDCRGQSVALNYRDIFADAWITYMRQGYTHPDQIKTILTDAFSGVCIDVSAASRIDRLKKLQPVALSDELKTNVRDAISDPDFVNSVTRDRGFDRDNPKINKIIAAPNGKLLLAETRKILRSGAFNGDEAVDVAISAIECPKKPVKLRNGVTVNDPDTAVKTHALQQLAEIKSKTQLIKICCYLGSLSDKTAVNHYSTLIDLRDELPVQQYRLVEALVNSDIAFNLSCLINVFTKYRPCGDVCGLLKKLADNPSASNIDNINRSIRYAEYGKIESPDIYLRRVKFTKSIADAEYYLLTRQDSVAREIDDETKLRGWVYPDPDDSEQANRKHFADGFVAHTVSSYDMQQIALQLSYRVRRLTRTNKCLRYDAKKIELLLKTYYSVRTIKAKDNDSYTLQIVGLRKRLPKTQVWAEADKQKAIGRIEDLAEGAETPADFNESEEAYLKSQINAALCKYTNLGAPESRKSRQNAVDWLASCITNNSNDTRFYYKRGTLAEYCALESKRNEFNNKWYLTDEPPLDIEDATKLILASVSLIKRWDDYINIRHSRPVRWYYSLIYSSSTSVANGTAALPQRKICCMRL